MLLVFSDIGGKRFTMYRAQKPSSTTKLVTFITVLSVISAFALCGFNNRTVAH